MLARVCTHCRTRSTSWLPPWRRGCSAGSAFAGPRHPGPGPVPASPSRSWPAARRSAISRHSHSVQSFPSSALQQKKKFDTGQNRGEICVVVEAAEDPAGWLVRRFFLASFRDGRRVRSEKSPIESFAKKKKRNHVTRCSIILPRNDRGYFDDSFRCARVDSSACSVHRGCIDGTT